MSEELTGADVLEKAADLIETVGHCKGSFCVLDPVTLDVTAYCAIGAITKASSFEDKAFTSYAYYEALRAVVIELSGKPREDWEFIAAWNDRPSRKPEDVVDTFKTVAKDLRNRGSQTE